MDDWDVVNAIFLHDDMKSNEYVMDAIQAEADGLTRIAKDFYKKALENDSSNLKKGFYCESSFKCFAALSDWKGLSDQIKGICDTTQNVWQSMWRDEWNQQKLLPWYITAEVRNILDGGDRILLSYLNESMKDADMADYLNSNYGEQLAILHIMNNKPELAKFHLDNCVKNFLESWSHLNPLYTKLRTNEILKLQNVADACFFLVKYNELSPLTYETVLEELTALWKRTFSSLEYLQLNETKTCYRSMYINLLKTKLQQTLAYDDDRNAAMNIISKCNFRINTNLIENSLDHGNYYIAKKHCLLINTPDGLTDGIEEIKLHLCFSKTLFLRAKLQKPEQRSGPLKEAWTTLKGKYKLLNKPIGSLVYLLI